MSCLFKLVMLCPRSQIAEREIIPRLISTRKSVMSIRKFWSPSASMRIAANVNTYDNLDSEWGMNPSTASASRCLEAARNAGTNVVMVAIKKTIAVMSSCVGPSAEFVMYRAGMETRLRTA